MLAVLKQLLLSRDIKLTWMAIYKTWKPTGVICLAMKMQLDWQVYKVPALFVAAEDGTINQELVDASEQVLMHHMTGLFCSINNLV